MIPILLLAAWLAGRQLTTDGYSSDEVASLIVSGGAHYGPYTPVDAWQRVAERSPDQAMGLALILSTWGRLVGWTEHATRALAFFTGLLAIAWVYRAGRDLFTPQAGLIAAVILAASVFFITYMHIIRIFTFVALAISLTLWSYWRVALHPHAPGRWAQFGLVTGGIALFYTHYFAVPFLIAIGLYHLLFVPKNQRWWRPIILLGMAVIVFLPELSVFVQGLQRNLGDTRLHDKALTVAEVVSQLIYYFTNGTLNLSPRSAMGTMMVASVACLLLITNSIQRARNLTVQIASAFPPPLRLRVVTSTFEIGGSREGISNKTSQESAAVPKPVIVHHRVNTQQPGYLLSFTTLALLVLLLVANQQVQLISAERIRYLMPLWPLLALLVGAGLALIGTRFSVLMWVLLAIWMVVGIGRNLWGDLQYRFDVLPRNPLHLMRETLLPQASQEDLMLIDGFWYGNGLPREFYTTYNLHFARQILYPTDTPEAVLIGDHLRLWFLSESEDSATYAPFKAALGNKYYHCGTPFDDQLIRLDLYVREPTYCIGDETLLEFDSGITLRTLGPLTIEGDKLHVAMGWSLAPDVPAETYSVGIHLYDVATGAFIAQADAGLSAPPVVALHREIDLEPVPPGTYEIRITVYNWQTGERLHGENPLTSERAELLPVGQISVD